MRRPWAGVASLLIALLGLAATLSAEYVLPPPPVPPPRVALRLTVGRLDLSWRSKAATLPPTSTGPLSRDGVRIVGLVLGAVAMGTAVASWVRREPDGWGMLACAFAVLAVAWQPVLFVVALFGIPAILH